MKARLSYIDALRAVAMLMVVFCHVRLFGYGQIADTSGIAATFAVVMVPLFFFVSGYVSHINHTEITLKQTLHTLGEKARSLLVPTIAFTYVYILMFHQKWFYGYWFTMALFEMYVLTYIISLICRCLPYAVYMLILAVVSLLLYLFHAHLASIPYISLGDAAKYFLFFIAGIFANHYSSITGRIKNNETILALSFITLLAYMIMRFSYGIFRTPGISGIAYTLAGIAMVYILYCAFSRKEKYWASEGRIQTIIKYVGRHTLELYMLHYFFLPNLADLSALMIEAGVTVDFIITSILTIVVTILALVTAKLLSCSKIIAVWLLGHKKAAMTNSDITLR